MQNSFRSHNTFLALYSKNLQATHTWKFLSWPTFFCCNAALRTTRGSPSVWPYVRPSLLAFLPFTQKIFRQPIPENLENIQKWRFWSKFFWKRAYFQAFSGIESSLKMLSTNLWVEHVYIYTYMFTYIIHKKKLFDFYIYKIYI